MTAPGALPGPQLVNALALAAVGFPVALQHAFQAVAQPGGRLQVHRRVGGLFAFALQGLDFARAGSWTAAGTPPKRSRRRAVRAPPRRSRRAPAPPGAFRVRGTAPLAFRAPRGPWPVREKLWPPGRSGPRAAPQARGAVSCSRRVSARSRGRQFGVREDHLFAGELVPFAAVEADAGDFPRRRWRSRCSFAEADGIALFERGDRRGHMRHERDGLGGVKVFEEAAHEGGRRAEGVRSRGSPAGWAGKRRCRIGQRLSMRNRSAKVSSCRIDLRRPRAGRVDSSQHHPRSQVDQWPPFTQVP